LFGLLMAEAFAFEATTFRCSLRQVKFALGLRTISPLDERDSDDPSLLADRARCHALHRKSSSR
jgi:hypothetical protein